jgi:hypothetical protein
MDEGLARRLLVKSLSGGATRERAKAVPMNFQSPSARLVGDPKPLSANKARLLRSHARMIWQLGRGAARDVVEIGRRLTEAKFLVGHGGFSCWIAAEFTIARLT